jgi:Protein of unknown function (DUF5672)
LPGRHKVPAKNADACDEWSADPAPGNAPSPYQTTPSRRIRLSAAVQNGIAAPQSDRNRRDGHFASPGKRRGEQPRLQAGIMMKKIAVLVPIYKADLDPLERYSLDKSFSVLQGRDVFFIGPEGLNLDYYKERYPGVPFVAYEPHYFQSIPGYNRLLLNPGFYRQYGQYEFMLILQTDAVLLRDELDFWCDQPFDYVGAPWPDGFELFVNAGPFEGAFGKRVKVHVGNGGLSLRRNSKCAALLEEFAGDVMMIFNRTGSSEDLFFSFMGVLSNDFVLPNEITASRFSLELKPSYYVAVNGGRLPMGGHAWWKHDLEFWRALLPDMPA